MPDNAPLNAPRQCTQCKRAEAPGARIGARQNRCHTCRSRGPASSLAPVAGANETSGLSSYERTTIPKYFWAGLSATDFTAPPVPKPAVGANETSGLGHWVPATSAPFMSLDRSKASDPNWIMRPNSITRTVVLFDVHAPTHDKAFWHVTVSWLKDLQPARIVLGGDFADMESASQHGGNPDQPKVLEDITRVREMLTELRRTCPDAEIVYLEGNHETRLTRLIVQLAPMLHGLKGLSLQELLHLDEYGIEWVPEDQQPVRYGTVQVLHGHQLRTSGLYPARKMVDTYGEPGTTTICGHYHKTQTVTKIMHPVPAVASVFGCGRTLDPKWMGGPTGWHHRIAVLEDVPGPGLGSTAGRTKVLSVDADDGVIVWGEKVYRA